MAKLEKLQKAETLKDFAKILGYHPKGMSYILYKLSEEEKYRTFDIPKKSGGTRTINAPEEQLSLLQKRLALLLYDSISELKSQNHKYLNSSYGFQKGRTVVSNAIQHRRRRYVFNIDIEDFFGAINFGRVRGFFIHDKLFSLKPSIATLIAQIACHNNSLPQGSPCSPVISNLIGNILDMRLLALARDAHCTYTRYADDLTFSTNEKLFPLNIARSNDDSTWTVGEKLCNEINRAGFSVNSKKTRMLLRRSRQTVTGLVVNTKVNISQDYYRGIRAMCNKLFQTGEYHIYSSGKFENTENLQPLEGMLSYMYFVKYRRDRSANINKLANRDGEFVTPKAPVELYRKFLNYKYFIVSKAPILVVEGISDIIYLQCAIRSLATKFPQLAKIESENKVTRLINFLRPSGTTRDVLNLGHGASGQTSLISKYQNIIKIYKHKPMDHPVIILCDNDEGAKSVFKAASQKLEEKVTLQTTSDFYYLCENLYLIKVPESVSGKERDIEDLFDKSLLDEKHKGKPFNRKKEHEDETAFGKVIFAEQVVRPNWNKIDFTGFSTLLSRVEKCISHYQEIKPIPAIQDKALMKNT